MAYPLTVQGEISEQVSHESTMALENISLVTIEPVITGHHVYNL